MSSKHPDSPCISVCVLDENDICMGCYRSADEVTDWFMATADQKCETLKRAEERREQVTTIRLS